MRADTNVSEKESTYALIQCLVRCIQVTVSRITLTGGYSLVGLVFPQPQAHLDWLDSSCCCYSLMFAAFKGMAEATTSLKLSMARPS